MTLAVSDIPPVPDLCAEVVGVRECPGVREILGVIEGKAGVEQGVAESVAEGGAVVDKEEEGEGLRKGEGVSKGEGEVEGVLEAVPQTDNVGVSEVDGHELWEGSGEGLPVEEVVGPKVGVKEPLGDTVDEREGVIVELSVTAGPEGEEEMEGVGLKVEDPLLAEEAVVAGEGEVEREEVWDGDRVGEMVGVEEPEKVLLQGDAVERPPEGVTSREVLGCPDSVTVREGERD